ncbi:MAG: AhpC/TSA family protein [Chitinophagaceae bacterium]|nr:MAG: AhpC/TSA family protein [Chitinophagaceae bacterium]
MKALFLTLFTAFTLALSAQDKPEGLFINSKAPDFNVKDQSGKTVSLKDLRKKGPVVIVFYRGNWCPYCNRELKAFQDSLQLLTERNIQLVAITPEAAEGVQETVKKTGATFPILYDADMKLAKAYGVAYQVDARTISRMKAGDIDLLKTNNQKEVAWLPVPAVYIVNRDGSITYRYFNENFRYRPSVAEVLAEVK